MPYSNPKQQKAAQHRWYLRNKQQIILRGRKDKIEKRRRINELKDKPCQDCGVKYPWYVMDFDHRDGEQKEMRIARAIHQCGWSKLRAEIAKCDVICANCHRIRTHKRLRKKMPRYKR